MLFRRGSVVELKNGAIVEVQDSLISFTDNELKLTIFGKEIEDTELIKFKVEDIKDVIDF